MENQTNEIERKKQKLSIDIAPELNQREQKEKDIQEKEEMWLKEFKEKIEQRRQEEEKKLQEEEAEILRLHREKVDKLRKERETEIQKIEKENESVKKGSTKNNANEHKRKNISKEDKKKTTKKRKN